MLSVSSRAASQRIVAIDVALSWAFSTNEVAREFCDVGAQSDDYPTVQASDFMNRSRSAPARKLIDGAENNWPSDVTTDGYRFAGYYTLIQHTVSPEVLSNASRGVG